MNIRVHWNRNDSDDWDNGQNSGGPNNNRTEGNNSSGSSKPNSSSGSFFYRDLTDRLRQLSFLDFRSCILLWLGAKGFRDICVLKRTGARGRRKLGGADFIAESPYTLGGQIAIQVRHWRTPVQRRAVDELAGFLLRQGIPHGLIVTNSVFSRPAIKATTEFGGRTIRLVAAPQLAGSLAALGLGVERWGAHWIVSDSYFNALSRLRLASSLAGETRLVDRRAGRPRAWSGGLDEVSVNPPSRPDEPLIWWIVVAVLLSIVVAWVLGPGGWR